MYLNSEFIICAAKYEGNYKIDICGVAEIYYCVVIEEKTTEFWTQIADEELKIALERENLNKNKAKNVILFVGRS